MVLLRYHFLVILVENFHKILMLILITNFSPNPCSNEIDLETKKYSNQKPDLIIGIGGGASMDVAKALSVSIGHDEDILIFDESLGGDERIIAKS